MAVQRNVIFTGRIGNMIFYKRNGKYCSRAVPDRVRQTKPTKARAKEFGKASSLARAIREQLLPVIPFPADNNMQTRLITAVFQWLKEAGSSRTERINQLSLIERFQFTSEGDEIMNRWKIRPAISIPSAGLLEIKIPSFIPDQSVRAPANTELVMLKISAGSCNPERGIVTGNSSTELLLNYDSKPVAAQTIVLEFPMPKGSLIVAGASLVYTVVKNKKLRLNANKSFMPAGIIAAMYI
ncbi:MAG TPA: hypothetical protein VK543_11200 [Puia sp.]|nr:hypothetical protein [Puia sp.]